MSEIEVIRPDLIDQYAHNIHWGIVAAAERSSGRYTVENIFDLARRGIWQVWIISEDKDILCIGGTEIISFPSGLKTLSIPFVAGKDREKWLHHMDDVLAWGKAQGATLAEANFRRGWGVFPGWTHKTNLLERAL